MQQRKVDLCRSLFCFFPLFQWQKKTKSKLMMKIFSHLLTFFVVKRIFVLVSVCCSLCPVSLANAKKWENIFIHEYKYLIFAIFFFLFRFIYPLFRCCCVCTDFYSEIHFLWVLFWWCSHHFYECYKNLCYAKRIENT